MGTPQPPSQPSRISSQIRHDTRGNNHHERESCTGSDPDPVVIEVTVGAPIETVWAHLRDPELIERWHGWLADGLDSEIAYIYHKHARETETPYVLELNRGSADAWVDGGDRFELAEADGATVVRITRASRGGDEMWDAWYDDITEGWTSFLNQLRFAVEVHPDAMRCTVFLNADDAELPSVRAALGLSGVAVGQTYVAKSVGELELRNQNRYVSEHQVGVTVDRYGPGLLIAADKPDQRGASKGAMAIVTTYGQDDPDFARTVQQWGDWWKTQYPDAEGPAY